MQQNHQDTEFAWLNAFCDMMSTGCAVVDPQLQIVHMNSNFINLLDIPEFEGQMLFTDLIDMLSERQAIKPGPDETVTTRLLRALDAQLYSDNEPVWIERYITSENEVGSLRLKALPDGKVLITADREYDITIGHHDENIKAVMDMGESGYWIYDCHTTDFTLNIGRMIEKLDVGSGFKGTIEDCYNITNDEDTAKAKAALKTLLNTKRQTEITIRLKTLSSQPLWVRTRLSPICDEDGNIRKIVSHFTDVTQNLRIQNKLRLDSETAEKALKARNNFIGRMSHEVRTPMNAVIGIADALIHHHGDPVILPKLELIQTSAEKIIRLVDETLQTTKLDEDRLELNPRFASPRKAVESVCRLWESKAIKEGIQLRLEVDPSVPEEIMFDDFRYEQCLNNLLSNAIKFTPGGKIQVILTTLDKGGERLVLVVKDTGMGMTEAQQANIYEAYKQADKTISGRFGGTGLGMHITKRIIELMGGNIAIKSSLGLGTVFALTLPIQALDMTKAEPANQDLVSSLLSKADADKSEYSHLKVLVADDNSTNHMVIGSLLGSVVSHIDYAMDGKVALEALAEKDYDLVFMDIHMPVMDGVEATLAIRQSDQPWADIPIIALTADPEYQQRRLCENLGMNGALAKPVKLTEILSEIDQVFETMSPEYASNNVFAA